MDHDGTPQVRLDEDKGKGVFQLTCRRPALGLVS
jgi:hypothetical protein